CVYRNDALSDDPAVPDDAVFRIIEPIGPVDDVLCHVTPASGIDVPPMPSVEASGLLLPKLTEQEDRYVDRLLSSVEDEGWAPLPRTNQAYHSRVRKLLPCEFIDLPGIQTHVCEVRVPDRIVSNDRGASYARSLYLRLPDELKKEYSRLVSDYLASRWWVPVARGAVESRQHGQSRAAAQVFLIPPGGTRRKARLVVDFRALNRGLPPAGNNQPPISFVIGALRAEARECIALADARSAFYKCRLSNTTLLLETGDNLEFIFQSIRMCFGVVFGPSGLSGNMGRLGDSLRSCDLPIALLCLVLLVIFVDDLCVSGPTRATIIVFKLLLFVLARAGFDAQLKKVFVLCVDRCRREVRGSLLEARLDLEIADEGTLLGVKLRFSGDRLLLDCDRSRHIRQVVAFLEDISRKEITTKRVCFKCSGCLAFDPAQQHVWARICADGLRALVGKLYAKFEWSSAIDLGALNGDARSALDCILNWMKKLCSETCNHSSPVRFGDSPCLELEAVCDASNSGGGYVIRTPDGTVILSCAVRWRKGERRSQSAYGTRASVTVLCDNKSCVLWSQSSDSPDIVEASRAVERRAIARLLSGLHGELVALKTVCSLRISHLAGHQNKLADSLSRAYDRVTPCGKSLADCLSGIGDISEEVPRDPTRSGIGWTKPDSRDPLDPDWEPDAADVVVTDEALCALDLAQATPDKPLEYPFSLAAHGLSRGASCFDTVCLLRCDRDKVFRVCNPAAVGAEPIIERFARHCFDISQLARLVWSARNVFALLGCNRMSREFEISVKYGSAVDDGKSPVLRPCGPVFRRSVRGMQDVFYLAYRTGSAAGSVSFCPVVPKDTPTTFLRALIIRSAHRETRHGSIPATTALVTDFHLPSINQDARKL
ncbi:hypothetical protein FOL47_002026, partial [Perkinsus chesapeaki]